MSRHHRRSGHAMKREAAALIDDEPEAFIDLGDDADRCCECGELITRGAPIGGLCQDCGDEEVEQRREGGYAVG